MLLLSSTLTVIKEQSEKGEDMGWFLDLLGSDEIQRPPPMMTIR